MKYTHSSSLKAILATLLAIAIGGCGGDIATSLRGVAATGAALANAPVFLKDAQGNEPVGQNEATGVSVVSTDAEGKFNFSASLMSGLKSPVLIKVIGRTVLDSGDDAFTSLHSIATLNGDDINVTPLTDVATTIALAGDPAAVFSAPATSLSVIDEVAISNASEVLMNSLGQNNTKLADLDVFKSSLDPTPTNDLSNPSAAKVHDMLLDSLVMVKTGTTVGLIDRNGPVEDYVSQPAIKLSIGEATIENVNGNISNLDPTNVLNPTKLSAFVTRLNIAFAGSECDFSTSGAGCGTIVNDPKIFSTNYKHQGMPGDVWLKKWVGEALGIEDFAGLNVEVKTAFAGSWSIAGKQVVRVLLQWQSGDQNNFVYRPMLLVDEDPEDPNSNVVAYGNQRDYFTWIKPTTTFNPDADNTYPFYHRFENGFSLVAGHWFAGQKDVVLGAHFSGPGLPSTRAGTQKNAYGDWINPNGLTEGVETFDLRSVYGCSMLSIDPTVYVEKNTNAVPWGTAWSNRTVFDGSFRYKPDNVTCDLKFDFLRYYGITTGDGKITNMPIDFVAPERGDVYTVTLYLSKAKVDASPTLQSALPTGATSVTKRMPNGATIEVYELATTTKLQANPIRWVDGGLPATMFPGITDATRSALVSSGVADDRQLAWARNFVKIEEGTDVNGQPVYARFVNYNAGIFESSYDAMRSIDSYSGAASANTDRAALGFQPFYAFFDGWGNETKPGLCGSATTYRGGTVKVFVQSKATAGDAWQSAICPDSESLVKNGDGTFLRVGGTLPNDSSSRIYKDTNGVLYQYYAARLREKLTLDRWEFINASQTTRTILGASIVARERVNSMGLCSVRKGFWGYRHAMVQLIDINGRGLMEKRQVWTDFPEKADITSTDGYVWVRDTEVARPNIGTDDTYFTPLYLNGDAPSSELGFYGLTKYKGERGFIVPHERKTAGGGCEYVSWQTGQ